MKRTRWFPVSTPPSKDRPGPYEFQYCVSGKVRPPVIWYWWDGSLWRSREGGYARTTLHGDRWRGLTEKAK